MSDDTNKKLSNEEKIKRLNEETEKLAAEQEQNLVSDYDAALEEYHKKHKVHLVKLCGKLFEIPSSMPFPFGMFYMRHCIQKDAEGKTMFAIPDDMLSEFIERMFGKEFLETVNENGIELDFILKEIIPDIMDKWGYSIKSSDASKDAPGDGSKNI